MMETIQTLSKTKITLFLFFVFLGFLFLIPNFFGERPVIQTRGLDDVALAALHDRYHFESILDEQGDAELLFDDISEQLDVFEDIKKNYPAAHLNLNLKPKTPAVFQWIGLKPMRLGLDLRGGVHFVLSIDQHEAIEKQLHALEEQVKMYCKNAAFQTQVKVVDHVIELPFVTHELAQKASDLLTLAFPEYETFPLFDGEGLRMTLHQDYLPKERLRILETTINSMRNRINELGVAEASIYTQGTNQIVIDLPGIQDVKQAKQLLGKTATVDFYLTYAGSWQPGSPIPFGTILKKDKYHRPIPLMKKAVLSGDAIVFAQASVNPEGMPCVDLRITNQKAKEFRAMTSENIGKSMAVVYKESYSIDQWNPKTSLFESVNKTDESVISVATIMSALGDRFQISGLEREQSFQLALMLRSGSLPAHVKIIEEKTIGPSLGADNIKMGMYSLLLGMSLIFSFMAIYYKQLGIIANLTLLSNLSLLVLSLACIQATLTLPGIAGIVLTLGMAVDANVLIFERIRDELEAGCSPWTALEQGFKRAADTILDSNLTTMIIGVVLFFLGSGAIKGFAVTLSIGLMTSMITALLGTKVFIHLWWGKELFPKISFLSLYKQGKTP
jgi:preprotein translocase subunit SecD